jgi:hypothetical protein
MAHYMQNHLSFEKIKDFAREYFFILFSLQAPCAPAECPKLTPYKGKIAFLPKNHLKPPAQCPKSTPYKGKLPKSPKTTSNCLHSPPK